MGETIAPFMLPKIVQNGNLHSFSRNFGGCGAEMVTNYLRKIFVEKQVFEIVIA